MANNTIETARIIDSEIYDLLKSLNDARIKYTHICARLRSQGVAIHQLMEKDFENDIKTCISYVSATSGSKLENDILTGKLDQSFYQQKSYREGTEVTNE